MACWVSLRGLQAPFSGEALPDVDDALAWACVLSPLLSAPLCTLVVDAGAQLGGDVLGRAVKFPGFLSCSFLGPLALANSRRAPPTVAAVPLTTGAAAFALGAELLSPAFFTFFALDASPGLLVAPGPSDFMAVAVFWESLLVRCTRGLSGATKLHFIALGCGIKQDRWGCIT